MHLGSFVRLAIHGARALPGHSSLCLNAPSEPLEAGVSALSVLVDASLDRRCEATMQFSDPVFLPIRYSFDTISCNGQQINNFTIPRGIPNGEVTVTWQCTGLASICTQAMIWGGTADTSIPAENKGRVGYILEVLRMRTTTAPITQSTGIAVETFPTVIASFTTSYLAETPLTSNGPLTPASEWTTPTDGSFAVSTSQSTEFIRQIDESDLPARTDTAGPTTPSGDSTTSATTNISNSASSVTSNSITSASNGNATSGLPDPEPTGDDGVFVSSASRISMSLTTVITMSLVSTLTVTRTISAECTSN